MASKKQTNFIQCLPLKRNHTDTDFGSVPSTSASLHGSLTKMCVGSKLLHPLCIPALSGSLVQALNLTLDLYLRLNPQILKIRGDLQDPVLATAR